MIYDGKVSYGVFGDTGSCNTVGQASYAMASSLGISLAAPNPGVENSVTYIAFVGGGTVAAPIEDHAAAVSLGQTLAAKPREEQLTRAGWTARYGVQHSSEAEPGQKPGVDVWPGIVAHREVWMHDPSTPCTLHEGGGVQHSSLAGPGQTPGVDA